MESVKSLGLLIFGVLFCGLAQSEDVKTEHLLESEVQLLRTIRSVTPLMQIFHSISDRYLVDSSDRRNRRDVYSLADYFSIEPRDVNRHDRIHLEIYGFGDEFRGKIRSQEYGSYSHNNYNRYPITCNSDGHEFVALLALAAMSVVLAYLLALALTTTTATTTTMMMMMVGRRRRMHREIVQNPTRIELLDAPTWLSMVQEMWDEDAAMDEKALACSQRRLCLMNTLARNAPTKAAQAVSLSSLPLSYLLHHRHHGGFTNYLEASFMGMSGANCSMIYSECPRIL